MDEPKEENKPEDVAVKLAQAVFRLIRPKMREQQRRVLGASHVPEGQVSALWQALIGKFERGFLYHYTDAAGLQGIITEGCFRASCADYLNDSSEIRYGYTLFAQMLAKWCAEHPEQTTIGERLLHLLSGEFNRTLSAESVAARIYVVCFCENGNLLSQWRAYGQSGGYAIGFNPQGLRKFTAGSKAVNANLKKVIYSEIDQRTLLNVLISDGMPELNGSDIEEQLNKLSSNDQEFFLGLLAQLWRMFALEDIVRFKHPAFEVEQEWRLVAEPSLEQFTAEEFDFVKFRSSRGMPVPYIELFPEHDLLPIELVRSGPTLERAKVKNSLDILFKKQGYKEIEIDGSDIPVRL